MFLEPRRPPRPTEMTFPAPSRPQVIDERARLKQAPNGLGLDSAISKIKQCPVLAVLNRSTQHFILSERVGDRTRERLTCLEAAVLTGETSKDRTAHSS